MKRENPLVVVLKWLLKMILLVAIIAGTFSYAMFQGEFVSWFLFYSVLLIISMNVLYGLIPIGAFRVMRTFSKNAYIAGDKLRVQVTLTRRFPLPLFYLKVTDVIPGRLAKQIDEGELRGLFYPLFQRMFSFTYEIPSLPRGEHTFEGVILETDDMFGLFKKRRRLNAEDRLIVYPYYEELQHWGAYNERGSEADLSQVNAVEDMTAVVGAREYVPGDRLASVDWKLTARKNQLMTKEFEESVGQSLLLVFNENTTERSEDFERAVELVASFVMYSSQRQVPYGLWSIGERAAMYPLAYGRDQERAIMDHLAKVSPSNRGRFADQLRAGEEQISAGTKVVIVTTELGDAELERLRVLRQRRMSIDVCLVRSDGLMSQWEKRCFEALRRSGVNTYLVTRESVNEAMKEGVRNVSSS